MVSPPPGRGTILTTGPENGVHYRGEAGGVLVPDLARRGFRGAGVGRGRGDVERDRRVRGGQGHRPPPGSSAVPGRPGSLALQTSRTPERPARAGAGPGAVRGGRATRPAAPARSMPDQVVDAGPAVKG